MKPLSGSIQKEPLRGILLPQCHICHQVPEGGIRGGIKLKRAFICTKCEERIVSVQVGSAEYNELMEKVKRVFRITVSAKGEAW